MKQISGYWLRFDDFGEETFFATREEAEAYAVRTLKEEARRMHGEDIEPLHGEQYQITPVVVHGR